MPLRDGQVRRLAGGTDTLPMLSAARRALKLLSGPIPVPRMGDSASRVISAQEALPGRAEPIPVAGKTARALSMRAEPAHCALPEKKKKKKTPRGLGRVPGRGLRVRGGQLFHLLPHPPLAVFTASLPPLLPLRDGWVLSRAVSCLSASLCLSLLRQNRQNRAL